MTTRSSTRHRRPLWLRWCVACLIVSCCLPVLLVWAVSSLIKLVMEPVFEGPLRSVADLLDDGP